MSDVLNCGGMKAEHRRANAVRLGIIGGQPERPAHYPARHGWQKLTHNGEPATGVLYASEWRCFETDWPYKLLTFVAVVRRHKCYKWQIQLEGQDLTKATAWLEASDIDKITGAKIHFRNGFVLESRDVAAVAVPKRMTEAEIQASAVILDVVERIKADASPASSKPKTKQRQAVTQSEAAKLCGVTLKTIQRWEKGAGTPEGYPGRQEAVTLRAWAARREEAAKLKRSLTKMTCVRDMDLATQKKQHSDWQADMRWRGTTRHRQSDY